MTDLKTKSAIVYDTGLFLPVVERLSREFGETMFYNCTWKNQFPKNKGLYMGDGIHGVKRIQDFWDVIREYKSHKQDLLVVFPDIHNGDLQEYLVGEGYQVWGSRRADELELERWSFKQEVLKDLGMPVQPMVRKEGLEVLRTFFKDPKNKDKFVKVSMTRGDMESCHHVSYDISESWMNEFADENGPFCDDAEFIVEDPIPTTLELGYDGWNIDGKYPATAMHGVEMKDCGYIGCAMTAATMPEPIKYVNDKMAPVLKSYGYRGNLSTEIRVSKDNKFYFIDPTMRCGSPPSQVQMEMISNWGEIMWSGAQGVMVEPKIVARYGVQAFIYSERCDKKWMCYEFPKELAQWYKFSFMCHARGKVWTIPQSCGMSAMGSVVAIDNDPMQAIKKLVEYSQKLQGHGLDVRLDAIPRAIKEIHQAQSKGYKFGAAIIPSLESVAKVVI